MQEDYPTTEQWQKRKTRGLAYTCIHLFFYPITPYLDIQSSWVFYLCLDSDIHFMGLSLLDMKFSQKFSLLSVVFFVVHMYSLNRLPNRPRFKIQSVLLPFEYGITLQTSTS